jgi:hypothetical protein
MPLLKQLRRIPLAYPLSLASAGLMLAFYLAPGATACAPPTCPGGAPYDPATEHCCNSVPTPIDVECGSCQDQ